MIDVLVALLLSLTAQSPDDPIRYCYTIAEDQPMPPSSVGTPNQPWSCYLEADRPRGYVPVWVGPQSEVNEAVVPNE